MHTNNPVLTRAEAFQPQEEPYYGSGQPAAGRQPYGQPYAGQPYAGQPYGTDPYQPYGQAPQPFVQASGVMTIDDVLTKTAITMGLLILSAAASFYMLGTITARTGSLAPVASIATVTGLIAFGTVLLVSFRRGVNPAFVLLYSVIEGVFIGTISLVFNVLYPGIVLPAAFGTFVAAGVTLAAYKYLRIKVSSKFRKMVMIGTMALAGVYLINFLLSLVGVPLGIISVSGPVSGVAILMSVLGVGLAVFNLILDFDYIERGIAVGASARESWRAAFGLTVTMVWLYIELLRVLSYFARR